MIRDLWVPAYIGIGSNLNQPIKQLKQATENLTMMPNSKFI
jgi:7,8-dihydro-6-hydroxymethylpterin-pyrophosphokinase